MSAGFIPEVGAAAFVGAAEGAGVESLGPLESTAEAGKDIDRHDEKSYTECDALTSGAGKRELRQRAEECAPDLPPDMPDGLREMSLVCVGMGSNTAMGLAYAEQFRSDPTKFLKDMGAWDKAYRESRAVKSDTVTDLVAPKDGERCPCCGVEFYDAGADPGGMKARESLERFIEANG